MAADTISPKILIRRVLLIICLTIVLVAPILPLFFREALGFILGAAGSAAWFLWLSRDIRLGLGLPQKAARKRALAGFYLRYLALAAYAVLVAWAVRPNLITLGLGLLMTQVAVFIVVLHHAARRNKYIRGQDG